MRRYLVVASLLLNGCASVTPPTTPLPAESAKAVEPRHPAVLQSFSLQGRVSVQYDEQSLSGQINWKAGAEQDDVLLSSPLGQGLARIQGNAVGVILSRPGEPDIGAENVESLTQKALGFRLPLSGLRFWVQANPDPASASELNVSPAGIVEGITQDGWKIDYLQYSENRPRKIHVTREGLQIRLVIDEWKTN